MSLFFGKYRVEYIVGILLEGGKKRFLEFGEI